MQPQSRMAIVLALILLSSAGWADPTRVYPYLQNLTANSVEIYLVSEVSEPLHLTVEGNRFTSTPEPATGLAYNPAELKDHPELAARPLPYLHIFRVKDLKAGTSYSYSVRLGEATFQSRFTTRADSPDSVRLIAYADSETEPESTGNCVRWASPKEPERRYLVDQTTGYRANLDIIRERRPDAILIAGDLVESGGEQRDWDEFWLHNTNRDGQISLASQLEILPASGNHEYYGGPKNGKYGLPSSRKAQAKLYTYFHSEGPHSHSNYYSKKLGPVRVIALDSCDGLPHRTRADSNYYFEAAPDLAPGINPGSRQYRWLENELKTAQREDAFTFVLFHHCPYSSGPHGGPPGPTKLNGQDPQSGQPLRVWTPLFLKYGVDAVINGHDEMFERSLVKGQELKPDGSRRPHQVHFYDVGVGGDGLRTAGCANPARQFLAETHAAEVWKDGQLQEGGRHYGHLEINVVKEKGGWKATLDSVYVLPRKDNGSWRFERRLYRDTVVLIQS